MPRAPSRNNNSSRPAREHKAPIIFNVPVELPSKEKKEPKFIVQRQNVNGLKTKPSYFAMVAKALYECRDPFHGMKFNDICKYIETNYPVTLEYRRFLKLALAKAVEDGAFVQLGPRNYKLATEERRRMKSGKTSRRRSSTKASSEKKKVTKKRSSTKKEGDEKKKSPKKRTTKNSKGDGEKKSTKKKRASKEEPKKSTKRKSVGKVDDEDESPKKKKSKSEKRKSEKSSGDDNTLVWFWQYYHDGWCNYHPEASEVVEATYQEYLRNPGITDVRSVESGEWNYMVDFRQMTQQNVRHEAHTVRRIRRVQIPKKDTTYRKKFPGTENDKTL
jgi:hypothetical protein